MEWVNEIKFAERDFAKGVRRSVRWSWTSFTEDSIAMRWFTRAKTDSGSALTTVSRVH